MDQTIGASVPMVQPRREMITTSYEEGEVEGAPVNSDSAVFDPDVS